MSILRVLSVNHRTLYIPIYYQDMGVGLKFAPSARARGHNLGGADRRAVYSNARIPGYGEHVCCVLGDEYFSLLPFHNRRR